jgi:heat-inducible transcriptional repressor
MRHEASQRNDLILDLLVRSYIETAEPIGSRTISKLSDLGLSPASIRNVMADLEDAGFLKQPHTSAGRIPTDHGYRYWVDRLMEPSELKEEEREHIHDELDKARTLDGLMDRVGKVISELTGNAALVYLKSVKRVSFLNHLLEELVEAQRLADFLQDEPGLFIDGTSRIIEQPEFQDIAKMRILLRLFDEKLAFLQALMAEPEDDAVHVRIGSENPADTMADVSLVAKDCHLGRTPIGSVAVVGPTRMDYPKVVSIVDYVAGTVSENMKRF